MTSGTVGLSAVGRGAVGRGARLTVGMRGMVLRSTVRTMIAAALAVAGAAAAAPEAAAGAPTRLTCQQTATRAMVEAVYGPVKKFVSKDTGCRWSFVSAKGGFLSGNTNGFAGGAAAYEQLLRGAKSAMKKYGDVKETKAVGRRAFEFQGKPFGMPGVQVGFLSTDGKHAVTITVGGTAKPSLEAARKLARALDARLSGGAKPQPAHK